jgi:antitoxin MazE
VITMKARLVRIGNSRGVRLPKSVIEQIGLEDEIEIQVEADRIVILPASRPRAGWAEAASAAAASSKLLDPMTATRFDEDEWRW